MEWEFLSDLFVQAMVYRGFRDARYSLVLTLGQWVPLIQHITNNYLYLDVVREL